MNILSESVADGNSYKGVYFKLSSDIDLSDSKEFSSIGYWDGLKSNDNGEWWESEKNRAFEGVFDGNGFFCKERDSVCRKQLFRIVLIHRKEWCC